MHVSPLRPPGNLSLDTYSPRRTVYNGATLEIGAAETLEECINNCINFEFVAEGPAACVGVNWLAPYEGTGDCYYFQSVTSSLPANEVGGYNEAALLIRDGSGQIYATPAAVTATLAPPTGAATTSSSTTPDPTSTPLGPLDDFFISVSAVVPRAKRAIYYMRIDGVGNAALVDDFALADTFVVDGNGHLNVKLGGKYPLTATVVFETSLQFLTSNPGSALPGFRAIRTSRCVR